MDDIVQNMTDAGCGADTIQTVCRLYGAGQVKDAVKALRRYRCGLMEALHQSQDKVDCLDHLVRSMEKETR